MTDKEYKVGVIAGNFDVIHPGYVDLFKECYDVCEEFIILLHTDPSIERPKEKLKPILSVQERMKTLFSFRFINNIYTYTYENELVELLKEISPDVRFQGVDYKDKSFTGDQLDIPIYWIKRDHGWSTTKFKKLIHDEYRKKMKLDD
jgi:glycerol-3-phosphate cytidylyltransferase